MDSRGDASILYKVLENKMSYNEATRGLMPLSDFERRVLDRINNSCILYSDDNNPINKRTVGVMISKSAVEELRRQLLQLQSQSYDITAYKSCLEDYDLIIKKNLFRVL